MKNLIKEDIKLLASNQIKLKAYRKPSAFDKGNLILEVPGKSTKVLVDDPAWATSRHEQYRTKIRHLHLLYDIVRGKLLFDDYTLANLDGTEFTFKKAELSIYQLNRLKDEYTQRSKTVKAIDPATA